MPRRPLLLLAWTASVFALAACGPEPAPPGPTPGPPAPAEIAPPTPFDTAPVETDSVEPPEQVVEIPPRPRPRPAPPTIARPSTPPPLARPASGSCDVREGEGYCFTFTGGGWTAAIAEARCGEAPDAGFRAGRCPVAGRIATCTYAPPSTPDREIVYTYYAPYDPALAELACPGTFTRLD